MTDEMRVKVEKVMKNLERNKMKPYFCENREEAQALVKTLIKKGETISCGGSKTLDETGIYQIINSPDYNFLDRSAPGMTRPEVEEVYRQTFRADTFFMSTLLPKTESFIMLTATQTVLPHFFTVQKALSLYAVSTKL